MERESAVTGVDGSNGVRGDMTYAGDISPADAYALLTSEPGACLVDVRTQPEWQYVGFVDLGATGKDPVFAEWQTWPSMAVNTGFVDQVAASVDGNRDAVLLFLCRSGVRSIAAATAMSQAGYGRCFNILEGFEGDLNEDRHRGRRGGWKAKGLPWAQR